MWENRVRKRIIRNIILAILCVAACGALYYAMRYANRSRSERDKALSEVSTQRKQEQEQNVAETLQAVEAQYHKDVETVKLYMPGIVCWGDTLTRGSSGNTSYPDVLQSYINKYICDAYDFSAKVKGSVVYSGLKNEDYRISIPVVNMGGGDENAPTILGRAGVASYVLLYPANVPSLGKPVDVRLGSSLGKDIQVNPMTVGDQGLNPVWIDGHEGSLSVSRTNYKTSYIFQPAEESDSYQLPAGAEVELSNTDVYSDYIHVIWLGAYDKYYAVSDYVDWCGKLLARQTQNTGRYLIIGPCTYSGYWEGTNIIYSLDEVDAAMLSKYGDHYISFRKYLVSDGLSDAKLTASTADKRYAGKGVVPESLRSANGTVEFSTKSYELLGKLVFERMVKLGYFAEITEELKIDINMLNQ